MGPGRLSPQANGIQPHGQAKTYGQISNQYFLSTVLNSGIRSQYLKKKRPQHGRQITRGTTASLPTRPQIKAHLGKQISYTHTQKDKQRRKKKMSDKERNLIRKKVEDSH